MKYIDYRKIFISSLSLPLLLTVTLLLVVGAFSLTNIDISLRLWDAATDAYRVLLGTILGACITLRLTDDIRKALCAAFCVMVLGVLFFAICGSGCGLLLLCVVAIIVAALSRRFDTIGLVISSVFVVAVITVVALSLYDPFLTLTDTLCVRVKTSPCLAAMLSNMYSLFFNNELGDTLLTTDYTGSIFYDGHIYSGVLNILNVNPAAVGDNMHFLTGRYIVNIFVAIGFLMALLGRFDGQLRLAFVLSVILSVVMGIDTPLLILVSIYNPLLYILHLVLTYLCYLIPILLNIDIGYTSSAGMYELVQNGGKWAYFLISGAVITILTYYACQLILARFDFDRHIHYPPATKRLIRSLGGVRNIECIRNGRLYVFNPNLIDILRVDCEIHENEITLIENDMELLQDYF